MKILYHASCYDGFCAAWMAHKVHPDAEFIPVQYGEDPPEIGEETVLIVDFSYKRDVLIEIYEKSTDVLVLDHHKGAKDELKGLPFCVFDMNKSGARLVQEYFDLTNNWIVDYTEDRDLWNWKLPDSRIVNNGLRYYDFDFDVWDDIDWNENYTRGTTLTKYLDKKIKSKIEKAKPFVIRGIHTEAVNCADSDIISDVAGGIAEKYGIGITYFFDGERFIYSVRSRDENCLGLNALEVAQSYGGGGHPNAAGFSWSEFLG